jgi:hypothetical protein
MTDPRRLARDVAKHIERRRRRRKVVTLAVVIAAIVAAVLYLGFGRGWGFGKGKGEGAGAGTGSAAALVDAGPRRCALRVTAEGITVDGEVMTRAQAVDACKTVGAADVVVTGDARQGVWDELRAGLEAAGIAVFQKGGAGPAPGPDAGT